MRFVMALALYALLLGGFLLYPRNTTTTIAQIDVTAGAAVLGATFEQTPELAYINSLRVERGLPALRSDRDLKGVANSRAHEISNSFTYSHIRPGGGDYSDLLSSASNEVLSCENLQLQSNQSIEEAVNTWLKSPSHENCLMQSKITRAAVSIEKFGDVEMTSWLFVFIAAADER
jgi:uncharacterized protein YkwD